MCIQKGLFTAMSSLVHSLQCNGCFSEIWLYTFPLIPNNCHSKYLPYNTLPFSKGKKIGYHRCLCHISEFFQNKIQIEQSNVHSKGSTYCNPPHRIRRCIPCDGCISEIRLCTFRRWHIWIGRGRRKYPGNPQPRPICRDSQSTRRTSFPWARRGRCRIYDPPSDRCDNLKKKHSFVYNPFPLAKVQFQNTVYCRRLTSFYWKILRTQSLISRFTCDLNFIFKIQLSVGRVLIKIFRASFSSNHKGRCCTFDPLSDSCDNLERKNTLTMKHSSALTEIRSRLFPFPLSF